MTRSSALISPLLLALLFAPACSDDGSNTEEVGETGDGDGDGDTSEEGTSETTDDDESTTETDESTTETDESTTETDDTSEDTTTDDTTDSTTGDPDDSDYSAVSFPGGLDRVIITRVDPEGPSCSQMVLVLPGFSSWSVELPPMWAIEEVRRWDDTLECDSMVEPDALGEGGEGVIEFLGTDAFDIYPCALSIDVEIELDTDPPSSMIWWTEFVTVEGVNCG